jgi:5-methylcytosine-specific restriction protein A
MATFQLAPSSIHPQVNDCGWYRIERDPVGKQPSKEGSLTFQHNLTAGDTITNAELSRIFKCATQGGMRRSHQTDSLVLISDHTKYVHQDRWISTNLFYYTGMGLEGDQSLDYLQNKTLNASPANGVTPYLFEVYDPRKYLFRGRVKLSGRAFEESQPDINGKPRSVWIFPLQVIGSAAGFKVSEALIARKQRRIRRQAKRLPDSTLFTMAVHSQRSPSKHLTGTTVLEHNEYVAELARRRANGCCQLCGCQAPFRSKQNEPYLEIHHIKWLSKGGRDTIENAVALCPNCHTKMHILNLGDDRRKLKQEAQKSCCQLTIDGGVVYV